MQLTGSAPSCAVAPHALHNTSPKPTPYPHPIPSPSRCLAVVETYPAVVFIEVRGSGIRSESEHECQFPPAISRRQPSLPVLGLVLVGEAGVEAGGLELDMLVGEVERCVCVKARGRGGNGNEMLSSSFGTKSVAGPSCSCSRVLSSSRRHDTHNVGPAPSALLLPWTHFSSAIVNIEQWVENGMKRAIQGKQAESDDEERGARREPRGSSAEQGESWEGLQAQPVGDQGNRGFWSRSHPPSPAQSHPRCTLADRSSWELDGAFSQSPGSTSDSSQAAWAYVSSARVGISGI